MSDADALLRMSPQDFVSFLKSEGIQRFHFVLDREAGVLRASHA